MKHIFIVNKLAGKGDKINNLINQINQLYVDEDYKIELVDDQYAAKDVLKKYDNKNSYIIYACGGDGTLHEVVNAIKHLNFEQVKLVIIPIGTGNDFAKSLGLSKQKLINLNNYKNNIKLNIDLLKVNNSVYGINTVSAGLDVKIAKNVYKFKKLPFKDSTFPYYLSLINSMMSKITSNFKLQLDDQVIDYNDYTFVVASNGLYYGGGYLPNPDAQFDDGLIDVCLIKKVSRLKITVLENKYKEGTHIDYKDIVEQYRCKKIKIIADDLVYLNIDGEVKSFKNPEIAIENHSLKIIIPVIE